MSPSPNQHLLNTSWTLHRLSPLHHGKEFQSLLDNPVALNTYASRLRGQLTGNAFSGISASAEDESLSRTGALKNCVWESLPSLSLLNGAATSSALPVSNEHLGSGIAVTLEFENITYKAALLAPLPGDDTSLSSSDRRKGKGKEKEKEKDTSTGHEKTTSTHLPLLMTRFPNPLRQTFLSFLSANFDTYVSNLRLSSEFMCAALESYLGVLNPVLEPGSGAGQAQILEDLVKELQLTVAFSPAVAPALRSLNVNVPRASLGSILLRRDAEADADADSSGSGSVLKGLSDYIRTHLAMDLDLAGTSENSALVKQHVRVSKIACVGFNMAGEGRLKLVGLSLSGRSGDEGEGDGEVSQKRRLGLRANEALLRAVVRRAAATGENQASS